jgi:hypothetical protein
MAISSEICDWCSKNLKRLRISQTMELQGATILGSVTRCLSYVTLEHNRIS